jgi:DNA polymerase
MNDNDRASGISALQFLPKRISLASMQEAVQSCRGCPLFRNATQAVFGEGPRSASIVLVGEQPGNDEDLKGHPFVGPAGRVLDRALDDAGLSRRDTYVTNVVKHFKWEAKGKRRMHRKPGAREISACLPWLEREIELIRPRVLVVMGATAAQALLGREFKVTLQRGQAIDTPLASYAVATIHPSAILRMRTSDERERERIRFVDDLKVAAELLRKSA